MKLSKFTLAFSAVLLVCSAQSFTAPPQPTAVPRGITSTFFFTNIAGSRSYNVYTPAGYTTASKVPLIVVLHGCTQTPISIAADSNFGALADAKQFIVAYPQESSLNNANGCWNYWTQADQVRNSGEPSIIAGIVGQIQSNIFAWNIDKSRTYVLGLSAGAAMSVIMGVTYPDVFAAIGVGSGLEYQTATSLSQVVSQLAPYNQPGPNPVQQGQLIHSAMGSFARRLPTLIFHGTSDSVVPFVHGQEVVTSMAVANSLADPSFNNTNFNSPSTQQTGQVLGGYAFDVLSWDDVAGKPVVQFFVVHGMDHRWSGGSAPFVGGADMYTDPRGPSFTSVAYDFFMNNPMI